MSVDKSDEITTSGKVVSIRKLGLFITSIDEIELLLPATSLIVAPFNLSAFNVMLTPSVSVCPLMILIENISTFEPEPDA